MFKQFKDKRKTRKGIRGKELPEIHEGLPDSERPSGLCPHCGKQSSFDHAGSLPATFDSGFTIDYRGKKEPVFLERVSSLICRHCNHGVVVVEEKWIEDSPTRESTGSGTISWRGVHWWPIPEANLSTDILEDVAGVVGEAAGALYANCPLTSDVMSRRALEAICADKGETSGVLADRLNALKTKDILQPTLADWAKEGRLIGNFGAHFDPMKTVTMDDAKQLMSFLRELMKYLYELSAELERKRSEGKQSKNP